MIDEQWKPREALVPPWSLLLSACVLQACSSGNGTLTNAGVLAFVRRRNTAEASQRHLRDLESAKSLYAGRSTTIRSQRNARAPVACRQLGAAGADAGCGPSMPQAHALE